MQEESRSIPTPLKDTGNVESLSESNKKPYSIYTRPEKWFIVVMIAFTGLFRCAGHYSDSKTYADISNPSPLTTNIYFPALPTLAAVFHKSTELINLTVGHYM
jgi:hypothetical protein